MNMGSSASRPERIGQIATQSVSNLSLTQQRNSFGVAKQRTDRPRVREQVQSSTTTHKFNSSGSKTNMVDQNSKTTVTTSTKRMGQSTLLSKQVASSTKNLATIKESQSTRQQLVSPAPVQQK